MKAFEEFCIGDCPAPDDVNCSHMTCAECIRIQEAAWRAAVEWVKKQGVETSEDDQGHINYYYEIDSSVFAKELEVTE